jgi:hypothetical protein
MISSTSIQSRCCSVLLALLATVVLAGCGGGDAEGPALDKNSAAGPATSRPEAIDATNGLTPDTQALVQQAVAVANAIEESPEDMEIVLADNNLTADEYVSMIYRISADPVLAKAYADARDQ